ncbi:MAG: hypothetical protein A4E71_00004 [Smithella sp. PtaU1.Bin162]|nr:MAG: hypothetical protein A4E71_00004 [Smithella sp. PtaU1.Bin162]
MIVDNPSHHMRINIFDSNISGMLKNDSWDELGIKPLELKKYLVFHSSKLTCSDTLPTQLLTEPCVTLKWITFTDAEYADMEKHIIDSSGTTYRIISGCSMVDITGLLCLPIKKAESRVDLHTLHVKSKDMDTAFIPTLSSASVYSCGGLWGLASLPFTDVGGNFEAGAGIGMSNFASTIEQAFLNLNKNMPSPKGKNVSVLKNKLFDDMFEQEGYLVFRRNSPIKTMCLIKKPNQPELFFWEDSRDSKNMFFELLSGNNKKINWKNIRPGNDL